MAVNTFPGRFMRFPLCSFAWKSTDEAGGAVPPVHLGLGGSEMRDSAGHTRG